MKSINPSILCLMVLTFLGCNQDKALSVASPNGNVKIEILEKGGQTFYTLQKNGKPLIANSEIALYEGGDIEILSGTTKSTITSWKPTWGQFKEINDVHNELSIELKNEGIISRLIVRAFDTGVAFRFETERGSENLQPRFRMEYALNKEDQLYMTVREDEPIGPIRMDSLGKNSELLNEGALPIVVETENNEFMAFLESDMISAQGFNTLTFENGPEQNQLSGFNSYEGTSDKFKTPWRVILLEDELGDLLTNAVPLNVASPLAMEETKWIKPGKTMWDWRVHGYTTEDGFTYGVDTESYLRFIDFAAENEIEYFLIDDAWYDSVATGYIEHSVKVDLKRVTEYADSKGVGLLLYYDRRKGDFGDKNLFPHYESLGMKGIKYGFMDNDPAFTRNAIRKSATSNLLIDFHDGPVPMTGVERTYPNAITREYCHSQQDARRAFTPEAFIKMAIVNALQGPLDMNNGIFDITGVNKGRRLKGPLKLNSLKTTVVGEMARVLIIYSGLVCIPDAPEAYEAKADLFEFIRRLPVGRWHDTKILHAKMGEVLSTARKYENDWFVGSVHAKGGTIPIDLKFLEEGKKYIATFYEDTNETHGQTNPEAYQIRTDTVDRSTIADAKIAPGGGHCLWIRQVKNNETNESQ